MPSSLSLSDQGEPIAVVAPPAKKARAETKKEKERRLNRVGLSYRCGRCGQPKKGHVCVGGPGPDGADAGSTATATTSKKSPSEGSDGAAAADGAVGTPPNGTWDLDSDSIFKDIKHVLQTPVMGGGASGKAANGGKANGKANGGGAKASGGSKRRSGANAKNNSKDNANAANIPPPMPAGIVNAVVAERAAEKSQLLEELDIAMQRPPSVITPEDGETRSALAGPSSLGPAPSSLVSATDMFSPGQLMTHLLGTPTPTPTPGLSPGPLNELGNML